MWFVREVPLADHPHLDSAAEIGAEILAEEAMQPAEHEPVIVGEPEAAGLVSPELAVGAAVAGAEPERTVRGLLPVGPPYSGLSHVGLHGHADRREEPRMPQAVHEPVPFEPVLHRVFRLGEGEFYARDLVPPPAPRAYRRPSCRHR